MSGYLLAGTALAPAGAEQLHAAFSVGANTAGDVVMTATATHPYVGLTFAMVMSRDTLAGLIEDAQACLAGMDREAAARVAGDPDATVAP